MDTSNEHLHLEVLAKVIHTFFLGCGVTSGTVIFNIVMDSLHFNGCDFFKLLIDHRNSSVEVLICFFWLLLEVLKVGTENLGCSFLFIDSQELCLDDVKLGKVVDREILKGLPPGESFVSHQLLELDYFPFISVPFGNPGSQVIHPFSGQHDLSGDATEHWHLHGPPDAIMFG